MRCLRSATSAISCCARASSLAALALPPLDLALARSLSGDHGGELSACEHATQLDPDSAEAWSRYAHALARSDRIGECIAACNRALELRPDPEVEELLAKASEMEQRLLAPSSRS